MAQPPTESGASTSSARTEPGDSVQPEQSRGPLLHQRAALVAQLERLEREAKALREQLARGEAALDGAELTVLTVRVGDLALGLPLGALDEVVPMARLAPLPEAPAWVPGVLDRAGALVAVLDLLALFARRARAPSPDDRLVLARADGRRLGLVVQEVLGLRTVPGRLAPVPPEAEHARYVSGLVTVAEGRLPVLSPTLLLYASAVPAPGGGPA